MPDRRESSVDEKQVKITLPVTIAFAVGLAMIVGTGMASYYGNRLAVEKNFAMISDRITKIESVTTKDVPEIQGQVKDLANIKQGVWILLHDRGYDADKILGKNDAQ